MSYPPPTRPPMIPSIPPPMMPPYGYPPMIPPPIMPVRPPMINQVGISAIDAKKPILDKTQSTTVFVGNISERAPDVMIRQMLQRCGNVLNWKRAQGANGKLQAFGFCEYDNPEATLRCIRLLNGYEIAEKKILVKVDQKTRELLGEHIKKKMSNDRGQMTKNAKKAAQLRNKLGTSEQDDEKADINLELVDEDTLKEDRIVISSFEVILKQYSKDLVPIEVPPVTIQVTQEATSTETNQKTTESITQDNVQTDKNEDEKDKDREKEKERDRERDREKEKERDKEREKDRSSRYSERDRDLETRHRSPLTDRYRSSHHHYEDSRSSHSPSETKSRSRRRSPAYENLNRSGSLSRNGSRGDDQYSYKENRIASQEETEEMRERKRLERKLREKEMAYRERLKAWESREQKKKYEYTIEKKKEIQRLKLIQKEAKKLKQFLEDYDDTKDDSIYFKGLNLEKKLKLREKEIELDNKDRQKERDELEELKRKLIEKGNTEDPDAEAKRIQNDENLRMKKKFEKIEESSSSSSSDEEEEPLDNLSENQFIDSDSNHLNSHQNDLNQNKETEEKIEQGKIENENMSIDQPNENKKEESIQFDYQISKEKITENFLIDENSESQLTDSPMKIDNSPSGSNSPTFSGTVRSFNNLLTTSVTIKSVGVAKKTIQPKNQIFADEEEDATATAKKAKLLSGMNSDERKKAVKKLVESIPTDRDELFAYPIDWEQLDEVLMEKRIKPWINKKIIEYIGEEEESLNDFICSKIKQQTKPDRLLEEVKVVLDEEAELFVKKMWRLIVYETESKRRGLSK